MIRDHDIEGFINVKECRESRIDFDAHIRAAVRELFFGTIRDIPDIPKEAMAVSLRKSELLQNDWIGFMKTGALPGAEAFAVSEKIRIYEGTGFEDLPFPQKEEVRAVYDSDLFDRLKEDFMRGRDQSFIA